MDIVGDRSFVEIPGDKTHELPPLLIRAKKIVNSLDRTLEMAGDIVESEEMIAALPLDENTKLDFERRRMDLALNLVEQYMNLVSHWQWGDSILEWIRQCETTFDTRTDLRRLLRTDVWPHAGRSSFVTLLADKHIQPEGVPLAEAVGLRLTFRQPPPLACFSNQFLLFLNSRVAVSAYDTWASLSPAPVSSLPPERFSFQVREY
ncbi:MAG: hypothetical protein HUU41_18445 [Bryobacteraceae bacterium]|nr:hypothetical protein [Bryobacterales bacterium]MEB2362555.1 hypothetical protein [Bryobacterales bacterium]NUN03090.1 hypothetical protein [Bryobacteraceae bacterium]